MSVSPLRNVVERVHPIAERIWQEDDNAITIWVKTTDGEWHKLGATMVPGDALVVNDHDGRSPLIVMECGRVEHPFNPHIGPADDVPVKEYST